MAKVTMPLLSGDARGKIADAIVFIGWKGIATARMWLKPANPKSAKQGNIRVVIGNLGRACGKVLPSKTYALKMIGKGVVPAQQSKQSYLVDYIKNSYIAGAGATLSTNLTNQIASMKAHSKSNAFRSGADACSLAAFDNTYSDCATWDKGLGIYLLAKAAIAFGFTGSPYTLAFASWTKTAVMAMVSDMQTKTS